MAFVRCASCGKQVSDASPACPHCKSDPRANSTDNDVKCRHCGKEIRLLDRLKGQPLCSKCSKAVAEEERLSRARESYDAKAREHQKLDSVLLTTTIDVRGFTIEKYFDVVCAQYVVGIGGIKSAFTSGLQSVGSQRLTQYEDLIGEARNTVMRGLKEKARAWGGNAVIGINVSYAGLGGDQICVAASGTVVTLSATSATNQTEIPPP